MACAASPRRSTPPVSSMSVFRREFSTGRSADKEYADGECGHNEEPARCAHRSGRDEERKAGQTGEGEQLAKSGERAALSAKRLCGSPPLVLEEGLDALQLVRELHPVLG